MGHLAQPAPKDGNSAPPAHRDHEIELGGRRKSQVFVIENHSTVSPVMGTSNPSCESPQHDSKDYVPGRSGHPTAPQQNVEQSQHGEGFQLSFVHVQAESTRHLRSHEYEFHEAPVPQVQQCSVKGKALSRLSEDECNRQRRRLNKSIKAAIQDGRQNGAKLCFCLSGEIES